MERDGEQWMKQRDTLIAKFKVDLEIEEQKHRNKLELAITELNLRHEE
jgi:hypothetical protein